MIDSFFRLKPTERTNSWIDDAFVPDMEGRFERTSFDSGYNVYTGSSYFLGMDIKEDAEFAAGGSNSFSRNDLWEFIPKAFNDFEMDGVTYPSIYNAYMSIVTEKDLSKFHPYELFRAIGNKADDISIDKKIIIMRNVIVAFLTQDCNVIAGVKLLNTRGAKIMFINPVDTEFGVVRRKMKKSECFRISNKFYCGNNILGSAMAMACKNADVLEFYEDLLGDDGYYHTYKTSRIFNNEDVEYVRLPNLDGRYQDMCGEVKKFKAFVGMPKDYFVDVHYSKDYISPEPKENVREPERTHHFFEGEYPIGDGSVCNAYRMNIIKYMHDYKIPNEVEFIEVINNKRSFEISFSI